MGIGEWSRGRTIGRGSSATVSLASVSGETFAVKSAELSRSAPLQKERSILSSLNCSYVVNYIGFDITEEEAQDGRLYYNLFMEYASGGSLSDYVRKNGRLDESAIQCRTKEIVSGIAYLHSRQLVHCDIKGENILIGEDGQAKIADFGCARWMDDDCDIQMRGTPMYMAPEVARGEEQGPSADVWALGCTVIEMATGGAPWPELSDPIAALHMIGFSSAVPELPCWISGEAKDFLNKCLTRNPNDRWTAEQLLSHPFVAREPAGEQALIKPNLTLDHTTPKSILDQDMWEVLSEQENDDVIEDDGLVENTLLQRLAQLACGEPSWTWDESWETVRSDGRECSMVARTVRDEVVEIETHDFITLMSPAIVPSTSGFGEDVEDFVTESDEHRWSNEGRDQEKKLRGERDCRVVEGIMFALLTKMILWKDIRIVFCLAIFRCCVSCWLFPFVISISFLLSGSSRWHILT